MKVLGLWVVLVVLILHQTKQSNGSHRCRSNELKCTKPPSLILNGTNLLPTDDKRVVLIALLAATCELCMKQAEYLEKLRQKFNRKISFRNHFRIIIINKISAWRNIRRFTKKRVSAAITVYQDNENDRIWEKLNGEKDDAVLIDSCGNLAYQWVMPYSYYAYPCVKNTLKELTAEASTSSTCEICG